MITDYNNKKAVITGAASGIGKALAVGMAYPVHIKETLDNSEPLQPMIDKVFNMLGKEQFFILTHDQFDGLIRAQGVFQADMIRPIDPSLFAK